MNPTARFAFIPARLAISMALVATLAACGGSSDSPVVNVATSNTTVTATPATAAAATTAFVAVASPTAPVTFSNGFSGTSATGATVAVTGTTTVAFVGGTATAPGFSMTNGGKTATGITTFGSCTFTFASTSPFAADHPWGPGKTLKVDPCSLSIPTAGTVAGSTATKTVTLTFGTTSGTASVPVTVATNGSVSVGGTTVGTVTVGAATGATGGGG